MGKAAQALIFVICCNVAIADIPNEDPYGNLATWAQQIRELTTQQTLELGETRDSLAKINQKNLALTANLGVAQGQMNKIGQERDKWKETAQDREVIIAKKTITILRLSIALGLLILLNILYVVARVWLKSTLPFI